VAGERQQQHGARREQDADDEDQRREGRAELELLRLRYRDVLRSLSAAEDRARRAERRLRSRLLELSWPAGLAGLAGGFAAVVLLRLAGL
jgi:hypothetical protein